MDVLAKTLKLPSTNQYDYKLLSREDWKNSLDYFCYFDDDSDLKLKNTVLQGYATDDDLSADSIYLVEADRYQFPYGRTFIIVLGLYEQRKALAHLIIGLREGRDTLAVLDLVLNKTGLTSKQRNAIYQLSEDNWGLLLSDKFNTDTVDHKGNFHMIRRLPNFIQVQGDFKPVININFERFPDNLTIHGNFSPRVDGIAPLAKWPSDLTVHGSMHAQSMHLKGLPTKLKVAGVLSISPAQVSTMCQVECGSLVTFSSRKSKKLLNFKNFTIHESVAISSPVRGVTNLKAGGNLAYKDANSSTAPKYDETCTVFSDIEVGGDIGVTMLNALLTFGPNIKCQSLRLYVVLCNQFAENIQIEKDLELRYCFQVENLPSPVIKGNLVVEGAVNTKQGNALEYKVKLPEHGVVYGDVTIPDTIDVPDSFCVLGTLTKAK